MSDDTQELIRRWDEQADWLYSLDNERFQGMASGYRTCARELRRATQ